MSDNLPLTEFSEGQWWIAELDSISSALSDDGQRAIAVVHHLLRSANEASDRIANLEAQLTSKERVRYD